MECNWDFIGLCLVEAGSSTSTIFGFSEFLTGLALLLIVYTITDFRYKFRISVSPVNLNKTIFFLITAIGIGTLITEFWVAQKWPTVTWNMSQAAWQSSFAIIFLSIVIIWLWYAFISPPKFSSKNYKKFSMQLYRVVLKGNIEEIKILSDELSLSIPNIVKLANNQEAVVQELKTDHVSYFANDMALLLANRRMCQCIADVSPNTALVLFDALSKEDVIHIDSFSTLTSNITAELIKNKNSQIYHEDHGYDSGLLGYIKPLSSSMFGNYKLLNMLGNRSVFDVDYKERDDWDSEQLNKYCDMVLLTFESYLKQGYWFAHSFILYRAISDIKSFCLGISEFNNTDLDWRNDAYKKFEVLISFAHELTTLLGKQDKTPHLIALKPKDENQKNLYDNIANFYAEIIHAAAYVRSPIDTCWTIQHNTVWGKLISRFAEDTEARRIILHKVRRIIYDEIKEFERFPNYKSTRYLGFCLNVLWINGYKTSRRDEGRALRKVVNNWFRSNYLKLVEDNPVLAESCLAGGITYNMEKKALVKSYRGGMGKGPVLDYFYL